MDDEAEGVWGHIISLVPKSEVFEIETLIGSSIIAENSALWRELKAFNSILTELHTLEFDQPLGMTPRFNANANESNSNNVLPSIPITVTESVPLSVANLNEMSNELDSTSHPAASTSYPIPLLSIPNALAEQPQANGGSTELTSRSAASRDSMDEILFLSGRLTVDKVAEVVTDIRKALRSERVELEAEIAMLIGAMDGEADNVLARQTQARIPSSATTEKSSKPSTTSTSTWQLKKQAERQADGRGSKFRNRLQDARDELHFLDDSY